jgi:UDP-GlcNAc:undecaprenyl-phosphate GlcNAc-1-phosphate transferase
LTVPVIKRLAFFTHALDIPNSPRKIHTKPIPLLGGLGIFFSFFVITIVYLWAGNINPAIVPFKFVIGLLAGSMVLMAGGFFDDKYNLPPKILWLFPAVAAVIVIACGVGVGITQLTNPFGGAPLRLQFIIVGLPASAIFSWLWLMGMMFTTKFLDGLDGLASGIGVIASLSLFFLSLTDTVNQPITATLAIVLAGAILGFLVHNFNPASIFLGEGGSTLIGFILGTLSILLGGKIATALLVMGVPILDVAWVIVRRLWYKTSPFKADRKHLHFRLLDIGFSQRQTVLILYTIAAVFGFTAVFLQSWGKLVALTILVVVMLAMAMSLVILYKRKHPMD